MNERNVTEFRQRQAAEAIRREHYKKIEGKRRLIQQGAPALFYPADLPCPLAVGDTFAVGSHAVKVGRIQKTLIKPKDAEKAHWEWRVELIHQERALYLGTRPPSALDTGRKYFSYAEEHGYETTDTLDAGSIIKPDEDAPTVLAREQTMAAHRKGNRVDAERMQLEARLNSARRRGKDKTAEVIRMKLRSMPMRQDEAA